MNRLKQLWQTITRHRPYTAYVRYNEANGNLLASGVAYYSFFSVFPALALGFTIFGFVLQGRPDLLQTIAESLNDTFPNMIRTQSNPTGFIGISAPTTVALTITGIVAFGVLLFAGLGWIGALRTGIRSIFGLDSTPTNVVLTKVRDLGVLVALGLGVAVSAIVSSAAGGLATQVAGWLGLSNAQWVVTAAGFVLGAAFDAMLMVLMLRVLTSVPLPWHNVRDGAIFGGVMLGLLKVFGSTLVANATKSPLLGTVAVAVGLLFWLNLMARVILLSAAWAATHVDIERLVDDEPSATDADTDADADAHSQARSGAVQPLTLGSSVSVGSDADGPGRLGVSTAVGVAGFAPSRANDRVTLVAGAVLGAVAVAGIGLLGWLRRR